jgi:hypothetical protein
MAIASRQATLHPFHDSSDRQGGFNMPDKQTGQDKGGKKDQGTKGGSQKKGE